MNQPEYDLSKNYPRSAREMVCGLVHVNRMIDKARAKAQDTLGEYIFPCPLDQVILDFLELGDECFLEYVCQYDDSQIADWIGEKLQTQGKSPGSIADVNQQILQRGPKTQERKKYFEDIRNQIDPSRTDITTWVELMDLEEGRLSA